MCAPTHGSRALRPTGSGPCSSSQVIVGSAPTLALPASSLRASRMLAEGGKPVPSIRHRIVALAIPKVLKSSEVGDPDQARLAKLAAHANADTAPPKKLVTGCEVSLIDGHGFPIYDLKIRGTSPQRSVIYLHGGGYVSHADRVHWKYVVRLARRLEARIIFPVYPLAPEFTWRDSNPELLSLFEHIAIESPRGVTLAGDSAGGGYALSIAQQLALRAGPQPTHVVLISPWLDLTNSAPGIAEAWARDPWLKLSWLRLYADWWAGGDELSRAELSPLYGDLSGLPPTCLFCGTRDTLHPSCRQLAERALEQGWDLTYVEEPDLLHVYPILPIPEAKRCLLYTSPS